MLSDDQVLIHSEACVGTFEDSCFNGGWGVGGVGGGLGCGGGGGGVGGWGGGWGGGGGGLNPPFLVTGSGGWGFCNGFFGLPEALIWTSP